MSKNAVVIGAVFVVIHASPEGPALLSTILDRIGPMRHQPQKHHGKKRR